MLFQELMQGKRKRRWPNMRKFTNWLNLPQICLRTFESSIKLMTRWSKISSICHISSRLTSKSQLVKEELSSLSQWMEEDLWLKVSLNQNLKSFKAFYLIIMLIYSWTRILVCLQFSVFLNSKLLKVTQCLQFALCWWETF